MKTLKEWTFLLYANGNNELEPETWQSVVDIQNSPDHPSIHVVVQVSRETQSNVRLLRPDKQPNMLTEVWSGVRRYVFDEKNIATFYCLTDINMAEPASLCDFIHWGIANFPAKRYMLSLSGHIYQFVGICPDYSGAVPLMMGFPELAASIQTALALHGAILDILVLDTCYASTVEILYEFGWQEQPRIKRVMTYIGKGPLQGLPYAGLLCLLQNMASAPVNYILENLVGKALVNYQLYGLIALTIEHEPLELVRQLFSELAASYLLCKSALGVDLTPEDLLSNYRDDYPWSHYLKPIHKLLKSIIIATRFADNGGKTILPIHVLYQKIPDEQRKNLYGRLAFAKQNVWTTLLCNRCFDTQPMASPAAIAALPIAKNILTAFIYAADESLCMEETRKIAEDLIQKKRWESL